MEGKFDRIQYYTVDSLGKLDAGAQEDSDLLEQMMSLWNLVKMVRQRSFHPQICVYFGVKIR